MIGGMLTKIPAGLFEWIIVADNGSTDATAEIASAAGAIVTREPERGYGATCMCALAALPADAGIVVFMQADCSEDAREVHLLLAPILDGRADMVIGSRTLGVAEPGALLGRQRFGNRVVVFLMRVLFGCQATDIGPFRAIRVDALRRLNMVDRNYGWTVEMQIKASRARLRVIEVPVGYRVRAAGENKVSGNLWNSVLAGLKMIFVVLKLRLCR